MEMGLNTAQRRAVTTGPEPMLIIAGPGTGKTKTLTARIVYLLREGKIPADKVVALTFTNKAAREMRERVQEAVGESMSLPKIATFHALCMDVLRSRGELLPIIPESERRVLIKSLAKLPAAKGMTQRDLSLRLSQAKGTPDSAMTASLQQLLTAYNEALQERGLYDFDDILLKAHDLLRNGHVVPEFTYVLVDEFQDTSDLQYEILKLLAMRGSIFAIGDPNQAIYAFRGAGAAMFDRFLADYPTVERIALTENYRSRPQITALANAIFPDSPQLIPSFTERGVVQAVQTLHEYSEAAYILSEIERGIGGSDFLKVSNDGEGHQPRDYAVLYRTHRAAAAVQRAFQDAGVPFQVVGEGSPYLRPDMQAIVGGMHYIYDQADPPSYKHYTSSQLRALFDTLLMDNEKSVSDIVADIAVLLGLNQNGYTWQFRSVLVQFGKGKPGLAAALAYLDDIQNSEFYDPTINGVSLMTIHAAKGLEFDHVFLIAAEEGVIPKAAAQTSVDIAEEQRLFYVAVSRAKHTLEILYAKRRDGDPATVSRFVGVLPQTLLPRVDDPNLVTAEKRHKKRSARRAQTSLF